MSQPAVSERAAPRHASKDPERTDQSEQRPNGAKTTLDLDEAVVDAATRQATAHGITLAEYVENALRVILAERGAGVDGETADAAWGRTVTVRGKPLPPGLKFDRDTMYGNYLPRQDDDGG